MSTEPPQTPDVDLPGQEHGQADLDIVVAPEPAGAQEESRGDEGGATGGSTDDPALGNTLIRPDNS